MRALILLSILGAATPALADDTFEAQAQNAMRVTHVDDLVWPFVAKCNAGTDTEQRQCRILRDARAAELRGATLLVDADAGAFNVGAWSPQKKSAPITLSACIRCSGVEVDADGGKKTWFIAGTREANQPPRFAGGKQTGPLLSDSARTFSDDATAKKYASSLSAAKAQFLIKIPANPVWTDRDRQGVAFEVVGYRVYSPCDGAVVIASPKAAGPGEVDKKACMRGTEVESLTPELIRESLKPVIAEAKTCYETNKQAGKGKLKLTIAGDGSVTALEQEGDFQNTPTGECIDAAVKKAVFPRSKKPKTQCAQPISLP